jgi:3-oxoacyl-[acyl-carrier-protein] synthase II
MKRRVVVTGTGWVTPLGADVDVVWRRLLAGDNAVGPITRFEGSTYSTNFGAEVRDFRLEDQIDDPGRFEHAGLNTRFALGAAAQAWRQSGLAESLPEARRFGLYLGSGEGSLDFVNFFRTNVSSWKDGRVDDVAWAEAARRLMDAHLEIEQEPNMSVSHVAGAFGCRGPAFNCMTACAASTQAVGEAARIIGHGDADVMFAGGAHSMIHPLGMTGFIRLTAMSVRRSSPETAARPFDQTRDGFVMGEGAGMLILESLEHAQGRGATILGELVGYGSTADAYRITDMHPEGFGPAEAMSAALRDAGIDPTEPDEAGRAPVQYISAHGTSTKENDRVETMAVRRVFGEMAPRVPFSSVKSMMGHLIQAAGAVELITCIKAIETGWVPPTINLHHRDPNCDLDYVPNEARRIEGGVDVAMSNGFGFGGQNDSVVVRRFGG